MGRPAVTGPPDLTSTCTPARCGSASTFCARVIWIAIDGTTGAVTVDDAARVAPRRPALRDRARLVRRPAHDRRARQCRLPGVTHAPGARVRGRRQSGSAGPSTCSWPLTACPRCNGDHGRRRRRTAGGARRAAAAPAGGLRWALRGDGRLPVTIRLLDPPLHEFLPDRYELVERITEARLLEKADVGETRACARASALARGGRPDARHARCAARVFHPEIYEMQVRAIFRATASVRERTGRGAAPRDHDPARRLCERASSRRASWCCGSPRRRASARLRLHRRHHDRAALAHASWSATLARHAEFFSFGTNDLTQTVLGISRDDIEGWIIPLLTWTAASRSAPVRNDRQMAWGRSSAWASSAARPHSRSSRSGSAASTGDPDSIRLSITPDPTM